MGCGASSSRSKVTQANLAASQQPKATQPAAAVSVAGSGQPAAILPRADNEDIRDKYELMHILGSGSFGQVGLAHLKEDPTQLRAVKVMQAETDEDAASIFISEIQFLQQLNHENIIRFYEFYKDPEFLYVVMELCTGGEVFNKIIELKRFSEQNAAHMGKQMLRAIEYIHAAKIAHRDIKAENFMLADDSPNPLIKMIDFGMACRFEDDVFMTELCGSPHYLSPELIGHRYTCLSDIWAFGVLLYLLMYGHYPFDAKHPRDIMLKILTEQVRFQVKTTLSDVCLDFLKRCLDRALEIRFTATQALAHPWILEGSVPEKVDESPLEIEIVRSAHRHATANRKKVDPKVEEQRTGKLKKLADDFQKGIRHGKKLHCHAFEARPEYVRRPDNLKTCPAGAAGHTAGKDDIGIGEALKQVQAAQGQDRQIAVSTSNSGVAERDAMGRVQAPIESLPPAPRRRHNGRFMTANPRRLAEVYKMSETEEEKLADLYAKKGEAVQAAGEAAIPEHDAGAAAASSERQGADPGVMHGIVPGDSGFLPGETPAAP